MAAQEIFNNEVKTKLEIQDEKFNAVLARVDATNQRVDDLIGEFRDFKAEMRQQNEMRANEIEASRRRIEEVNEKIDSKFEKILSQMHGMAVATVVGVGAIVVGIMSFMKP